VPEIYDIIMQTPTLLHALSQRVQQGKASNGKHCEVAMELLKKDVRDEPSGLEVLVSYGFLAVSIHYKNVPSADYADVFERILTRLPVMPQAY
ncbi:hypothetical protein PENTCL1PPCAC_26052, partial [Pristionchus entomophagus]